MKYFKHVKIHLLPITVFLSISISLSLFSFYLSISPQFPDHVIFVFQCLSEYSNICLNVYILFFPFRPPGANLYCVNVNLPTSSNRVVPNSWTFMDVSCLLSLGHTLHINCLISISSTMSGPKLIMSVVRSYFHTLPPRYSLCVS